MPLLPTADCSSSLSALRPPSSPLFGGRTLARPCRRSPRPGSPFLPGAARTLAGVSRPTGVVPPSVGRAPGVALILWPASRGMRQGELSRSNPPSSREAGRFQSLGGTP